MEQLVVLVIIGIVSLVNWLWQRASEARERQKQERERLGIPEGNPFCTTEDEEEPGPAPQKDPGAEMRRLMEALGVPVEPPAPIQPVRKEPVVAPPVLPVRATFKPAGPVRLQSPVFEKPLPKYSAAMPAQTPDNPIARALKSRDGIRQAVILREILGPPKAFTL